MIATAFTALAFTSFTNQHELGPVAGLPAQLVVLARHDGPRPGRDGQHQWVGLFTIAWVGSLTLVQLWVLLGDARTVTPRIFAKHFMARVFCLIVIPLAFYMAMFAVHFVCLVNPGDGDGFIELRVQATLNSKAMQDTPVDVMMGSRGPSATLTPRAATCTRTRSCTRAAASSSRSRSTRTRTRTTCG